MITRAHAMPFVNQPVMVDMMDGTTQRGVLHTVTNEGVYLRPMGGARLASESQQTNDVQILQDTAQSIEDIEETFFPFFFFPFFFIRRIRPFFFF